MLRCSVPRGQLSINLLVTYILMHNVVQTAILYEVVSTKSALSWPRVAEQTDRWHDHQFDALIRRTMICDHQIEYLSLNGNIVRCVHRVLLAVCDDYLRYKDLMRRIELIMVQYLPVF